MGALWLDAVNIKIERVIADFKAAFLRDAGLPSLYFWIVELFDTTALKTHEVVVMAALVELKN